MKNKFKIAIIGSGTMGNGIAHVSAQSGFHTTLVDIDKNQLDKASQNINFNLDRQINKKVISEIDKKNTLNKLNMTTDLENCKNCDLVIANRNRKNRVTEILLSFISQFKYKVSDPVSGLKIYNVNTG